MKHQVANKNFLLFQMTVPETHMKQCAQKQFHITNRGKYCLLCKFSTIQEIAREDVLPGQSHSGKVNKCVQYPSYNVTSPGT